MPEMKGAQSASNFLGFTGCAVAGLILWIAAGTIFYHVHNDDWTFEQGFYYALQAGFSVGFGALSEEDNSSRLYTIFHVLIGSGFIAGALGLFVQVVLDKSEKQQENLRAEFLQEANDGSDDGLAEDIVQCGRQIGIRFMNFDAICYTLFILWVSVGTAFACTQWNVSVIEGVYFAITAMSTGGLFAPPTDAGSMWFTAFFILIGVPLYGCVLGNAASTVVDPYVERKFKAQLKDATELDVEEFVRAAGCDNALTYAEFLEFCMQRAFRATPEHIAMLRQKFEDMGPGDDGILTLEELGRTQSVQTKTVGVPVETSKRSLKAAPSWKRKQVCSDGKVLPNLAIGLKKLAVLLSEIDRVEVNPSSEPVTRLREVDNTFASVEFKVLAAHEEAAARQRASRSQIASPVAKSQQEQINPFAHDAGPTSPTIEGAYEEQRCESPLGAAGKQERQKASTSGTGGFTQPLAHFPFGLVSNVDCGTAVHEKRRQHVQFDLITHMEVDAGVADDALDGHEARSTRGGSFLELVALPLCDTAPV
jgi:hypothetical protein